MCPHPAQMELVWWWEGRNSFWFSASAGFSTGVCFGCPQAGRVSPPPCLCPTSSTGEDSVGVAVSLLLWSRLHPQRGLGLQPPSVARRGSWRRATIFYCHRGFSAAARDVLSTRMSSLACISLLLLAWQLVWCLHRAEERCPVSQPYHREPHCTGSLFQPSSPPALAPSVSMLLAFRSWSLLTTPACFLGASLSLLSPSSDCTQNGARQILSLGCALTAHTSFQMG